MGKHKNRTQNTIIMEFMEKYPDLAKGYSKRDKPTVDALWQQLTESVNGAGPPQFDANGWKKKWVGWKSEVKRKLAQNIEYSTATGGESYAQHHLTPTEEAIVRLCGIAQSVEPVPGISLGLNEDVDASTDAEMPSTSSKRSFSEVLPTTTPKKFITENTCNKFLDEKSKRKLELNEKLEELIKIELKNASSLRRTYRAIKKGNKSVTRAISDFKEEFARCSEGILKCKQEKIALMKRKLDLETQKFEIEKNKPDDFVVIERL